MPQNGEIYYFEKKQVHEQYNPVVLLHGAGGDHLHWPHQLRRLPDLRVLAPDLPGHGRSLGLAQQSVGRYAGLMVAWFRALGLRQVILVGHSLGSAIAQHIALEHPEHVRGLVLIGSGARLPVNPDLLEKTSRQSTYSAAVDFIVKWSYAPHIGQAMKKQVREIMLATRPSVLHSDLLACQGFDTQAQAAVITQPALLLVGELDKMTPPRLSEQLCELLPDARLEVIPGAGHMLMLEQPAAVAAAVRDFAQIFLEEDHPKPP